MATLGCVGTKRDITHNTDYLKTTDYEMGKEYTLKESVFLEKLSSRLVLTREGGLQGEPWSIEEYDKGNKSKWPEVVGVLRVGTRLKVKSLILESSFEMGNLVWIQAEVIEGEYAGKMVDLTFISKRIVKDIQGNRPASVPFVDPRYLEPTTHCHDQRRFAPLK